MELPGAEFITAVGTVLGTAVGFFAGARGWWFKDRRNSRKDRVEDKISVTFSEAMTAMQQHIHDSALDRAQLREQLNHCLAQHAECRDEMHALRDETQGLRIRVDELERERYE